MCRLTVLFSFIFGIMLIGCTFGQPIEDKSALLAEMQDTVHSERDFNTYLFTSPIGTTDFGNKVHLLATDGSAKEFKVLSVYETKSGAHKLVFLSADAPEKIVYTVDIPNSTLSCKCPATQPTTRPTAKQDDAPVQPDPGLVR